MSVALLGSWEVGGCFSLRLARVSAVCGDIVSSDDSNLIAARKFPSSNLALTACARVNAEAFRRRGAATSSARTDGFDVALKSAMRRFITLAMLCRRPPLFGGSRIAADQFRTASHASTFSGRAVTGQSSFARCAAHAGLADLGMCRMVPHSGGCHTCDSTAPPSVATGF